MKRCIAVLIAGVGVAAVAPAQAEVFYSWVDVAQKPKLVTMSDTLMRKQLCSRSDVDGSCLDGQSAKEELLKLQPPPVDTPPPPVIDTLPPVVDSSLPIPIAEQPVTTPVPEPAGLSLAALGAVLLAAVFGKGRRRERVPTRPALHT
jgi:hypothetical protein